MRSFASTASLLVAGLLLSACAGSGSGRLNGWGAPRGGSPPVAERPARADERPAARPARAPEETAPVAERRPATASGMVIPVVGIDGGVFTLTRLALQQQRTLQLHGEEDGGGELARRMVTHALQGVDQVVDAGGARGGLNHGLAAPLSGFAP